ncbi:MAG: MFS transporter [Mailhella sp.]|nr:MFS transporter [Mailhella sp.]
MDYKKISLISLGHLSCDINAHALPALLPYLAAAHDFDYQTCGLLAFAYSAVSSIVQPILGLVADKFSRGWFIPLGILMAGVGFGFTGFLDTAPAIFLALLIAGVGGAVFHPEGARYANIVSGQRKGVGLSIFSVGGNGGMVMGPLLVMFAVAGFPVAGFTIGGFGLGGTALFSIIGIAMSAVLFQRIRAWNIEARKTGNKMAPAPGVNDWHAFGILSVCLLTRAGIAVALSTYLPLYWQGVFHTSAETGNIVLVLFCLFGVVSNLSGGAAADRWGYSTVVRFCSMLCLPCIVAFPFVSDPHMAALLLVPIAVGLFAPFSSMVVLGQRYLAKNVGFASGITLGLAFSIGGMFAPFLGFMADLWGGLGPAMHLFTPLAIACVAFAWFLKEPERG